MKRNIEMEDTLQERVDQACDEVKDMLVSYLEEDPDTEEAPDLGDLDDAGRVHEIVDGAVPIYTKEIDDTWYLHKDKLIEAYENAGVGDNPMENDGMAAIYFYIAEQVAEWYSDNAQDTVDKWREEHVGDVDEWRRAGFERGEGIADAFDVSEIVEEIVEIEDENEAEQKCREILYEAEQNGRQFSPFEFTAKEINDYLNDDEVWEAFDEGIAEAFQEAWDDYISEAWLEARYEAEAGDAE